MPNRNVYFYTKNNFADYIISEQKKIKEKTGVKMSTADCTSLLYHKVLVPNGVSLLDSIKDIKVPKLKKLRLNL